MTSAVIRFMENDITIAAIYKHGDGYPESKHGVLKLMEDFFTQVERDCGRDTRFNDASYLAAKFVVYLSGSDANDLNFLGVGVVPSDSHGNYTYLVHCRDGKRPIVEVK